MKKITVFLIGLAMCLSLCGCGKSEAVKNVESRIEGIGTVSWESEAAIAEVEKAYDALTDKEKSSVGNYEALTAAKEALEEAIQQHFEQLRQRVIGEWVDESGLVQAKISFLEDGSFQLGSVAYGDTWELSEDGEAIYVNGWENYAVLEENGLVKLVNKASVGLPYDGVIYVREKDFQAAHNEKYVTVELTTENVSDYMGEAVFIGYERDEFGEEKTEYSCYAFPSLVRDQGLIYLGAADAAVEVILQDKDDPSFRLETTLFEPFGSWGVMGYVSSWEEIVGLGRARGEIVFVKEEYVRDVTWSASPYGGKEKMRTIVLDNGIRLQTFGNSSYEEQLISSGLKY